MPITDSASAFSPTYLTATITDGVIPSFSADQYLSADVSMLIQNMKDRVIPL